MKTALITGGARGIGRAIAHRLQADGLDVAVVDRAEPVELRHGIRSYRADVGSEKELRALAAELQNSGGVDVLINNAAVRGPTAPATEYPVEEWQEVLRVNLTGPFLCCRAFAPGMRQKGWGRIVNISSMAGKAPYPLRSAYVASKWGLIGLTLTLAQELGPHGITVNAVCPGPVDNEAMRRVIHERAEATGQLPEDIQAEFLRHQAIPRMVSEEDVADLVSYLVSDSAWSVTGQAIEVAGGYRG